MVVVEVPLRLGPFKFHFIRLFRNIITGRKHNRPSIHEGEPHVGGQKGYKGAVRHNGKRMKQLLITGKLEQQTGRAGRRQSVQRPLRGRETTEPSMRQIG